MAQILSTNSARGTGLYREYRNAVEESLQLFQTPPVPMPSFWGLDRFTKAKWGEMEGLARAYHGFGLRGVAQARAVGQTVLSGMAGPALERIIMGGKEMPFTGILGRTPGQHLRKGLANIAGYATPAFIGLDVFISGAMALSGARDTRLFEEGGMARTFTQGMAYTPGFLLGVPVGMALGALVGGAPGAAVGGVLGALFAPEMAAQFADIPFKLADIGREISHRNFGVPSSYMPMTKVGITMRQRALNSIRESEMNARYAFGQEALMYH